MKAGSSSVSLRGALLGPDPARLAAAPVATIRLDRRGRISDATVAAAAMLGFEPQELRGRSLKDLALEGWQAAAEVATARVRFGATDSFELALKGRSGRRTLVEMMARSVAGPGDGTTLTWSERRPRRAGPQPQGSAERQRVAYELLRIQEAERLRVALALHDEIAPVVVMAKYLVEDAIHAGAGAESTQTLQGAALRLRSVVAELHRLAAELRPSQLDDLGLLPALEWLCRGQDESSRGLRIERHFQIAEAQVPDRLKPDIFRMVEDALSNVVKHACATRAVVSLALAGAELCVRIEDDGRGFDLGVTGPQRDGLNLGLHSIRQRVEATGGRFLFESYGQQPGTCIGGAWRLEPTPPGPAEGYGDRVAGATSQEFTSTFSPLPPG